MVQIYFDPKTGNYVDAQGNQYTSAHMQDQFGGEMFKDAYGMTYNSQQVQLVQGPPPPIQQQTQDTTGGGTAPAQTTPNMVTFKGVQYDLNNAGDRNTFIQTQSAEVDKKLNDALKSGQLGYAAKLLDYKHQWEAQGKTFQEGYNQGQTARQQAYQGLGTRAYQSSMGNSGQYALNQLGNAQNERNYNKNQFNTGLDTAYNDWIKGVQGTAQTQKDTLATNVGNIGGFDTSKIANPTTDLTQYTPYTNFQQFSSAPVSQGGGKSLAPAQQMTLSQWLGQQTGNQADTLKQYLLGKS